MTDISIRADIRFSPDFRSRPDQVKANYHNHVVNIRISMSDMSIRLDIRFRPHISFRPDQAQAN
jgi:hypothetical protein